MNSSLARIPCTIVTGFLGAGKTTLIRHVHRQRARPPPCRHRQRVRRRRHRRRNSQRLRQCRLPRGEHRRTGQRLSVLHGRRRIRAGARRHSCHATASSTSSSKLPASLCRSRWCRRSIGRRSRAALPSTASWSSLTAPRSPTAASRMISTRSRSNARPMRRSTHDDPIEEVFEDQIACADLVVLNKRDLIDAAGIEKAHARDRRRAAAQREGDYRRRRQGRSGAAARARRRHRRRHRQPPHPPRCRRGARSRRFQFVRRAARTKSPIRRRSPRA